MTKERPTHLCSLEIDPRDPSAIIQAQADRIAELETDADRLETALKTALRGNSAYRETLEKCSEAFEFLARYYFPDGTEARDLVKQALQR